MEKWKLDRYRPLLGGANSKGDRKVYNTLRIGDYVIIAREKSRSKPKILDNKNTGKIIDLKWNMAKIHFRNGSTQWVELIRVYHESTSKTPEIT